MPKVAIAIKSCQRYSDRRAAVRSTWLQRIPKDWDAFFVIGDRNTAAKDIGSDVLACDVSDAFANIAPKVKCAVEYAIQERITNLLICDDDTYLVPERAAESGFEHIDYMGHMRTDCLDYNKGFPYAQGSCYWLGQIAMHHIACDKEHMTNGVIDDGAVGRVLDGKVPFTHERRFYPGPDCLGNIPHANRNATISTHKCLPKQMLAVHDYYMKSRGEF
jgi:hypothetical protein